MFSLQFQLSNVIPYGICIWRRVHYFAVNICPRLFLVKFDSVSRLNVSHQSNLTFCSRSSRSRPVRSTWLKKKGESITSIVLHARLFNILTCLHSVIRTCLHSCIRAAFHAYIHAFVHHYSPVCRHAYTLALWHSYIIMLLSCSCIQRHVLVVQHSDNLTSRQTCNMFILTLSGSYMFRCLHDLNIRS